MRNDYLRNVPIDPHPTGEIAAAPLWPIADSTGRTFLIVQQSCW
jgi:hypothetical protein